MVRPQKTTKRHKPKAILRFPDLEQSKNAVVNSLAATSSQESYGHAIDEFIGWYCSEPRLAFNRTVVLRYRFFLEQKNLAPSTINVRLAAVRRLAYEASDSGRHSTGEGSQAVGNPHWELADGGSVPLAPTRAVSGHSEGEAGSGNPSGTHRMRS